MEADLATHSEGGWERPAERNTVLQRECFGDEELESEVRSLLAAHDGLGTFPEAVLDLA